MDGIYVASAIPATTGAFGFVPFGTTVDGPEPPEITEYAIKAGEITTKANITMSENAPAFLRRIQNIPAEDRIYRIRMVSKRTGWHCDFAARLTANESGNMTLDSQGVLMDDVNAGTIIIELGDTHEQE